MADETVGTTAKIAFSVRCDYKGGIEALGPRGKHFWIGDGQLGIGELKLTHGIPLGDVSSVTVNERQVGGSDEQTLVAAGVSPGFLPRPSGRPASRPKQVTDVTVRTKDGQEGLWVIDHRGGDWVSSKLGPALAQAGISL